MRLRIIIIIGLCVLTVAKSYAQVDPNKSVREHKLARYKNMRDGGLAMIVVGSVLVVVGGAIEAKEFEESLSTMFTSEPEKENNNVGTVLFCSGAVLAGGGVPLTIIGSRKYKTYKNNPDALSLGITTRPGSAGLRLTFRF